MATAGGELRVLLSGHSRGLGGALLDGLLERGAQVMCVARQRIDAPVPQHALDLADAQALQQWLCSAEFARFFKGADRALLLNNAGAVTPIAAPGRQGAAALAAAVALNVQAPLMLCDAFVAATAAVPDRRVLHVSSGAGRNPHAGWSAYCATKAALDMHARAVQLDQLPGLRIASVAPGVIDTEMQAQLRSTPEQDFPQRSRFVSLKENDGLSTPADAARRLLDAALSDGFGREAVTDLRSG